MRDAVAASREAEDSTPGHRGAPPVVYASRTHSQLAQAMAELRRTAYAAETTAVALGSRAQLCCNPAVATLGSGAAANQACSAAVRSGSCGWHSRVDGFLRDNPGAASVGLGLEELHRLAGDGGRVGGGGTGPCPFYVSRGLAPTADVVFVPYNYLVDPRSRAGLRQLAWRGAVVVFDEAHNLEGAAADAASFDLTAPALAAAIDEAGLAANAAQRRSESEGIGGGGGAGNGGGGGGDRRGQRPAAAPTSTMGASSADAGTGPPDYGSMARDLRLLSGVLKGLESAIARAAEGLLPPTESSRAAAGSSPSSSSSFGGGGGGRGGSFGGGAGGGVGAAAGKTFPAQFLFDLLGSVGITPSSMLPLTRLMDDASDVLAEEAARNGARAASGGVGVGAALAALADCLRLAFESSEPPSILPSSASSGASGAGRPGASSMVTTASPAAAESYRVHLWRSAPANNSASSSALAPPPQSSSSSNRRWGGNNNNTASAPTPPPTSSTPTLSYWCFSAGVALRAVAAAGARSLLLTSGTLSPLPALAAELAPLAFPVTLENPHVVPDSHVWASVVSSGPMGARLNSSFRTRESGEYKSDLGCLVASVAAAAPGGLLVFFPSYAALGSAVSHWKSARAPAKLAPPYYSAHSAATIWDAICWAKGRVFVVSQSVAFLFSWCFLEKTVRESLREREKLTSFFHQIVFSPPKNNTGTPRQRRRQRRLRLRRPRVPRGARRPRKQGRRLFGRLPRQGVGGARLLGRRRQSRGGDRPALRAGDGRARVDQEGGAGREREEDPVGGGGVERGRNERQQAPRRLGGGNDERRQRWRRRRWRRRSFFFLAAAAAAPSRPPDGRGMVRPAGRPRRQPGRRARDPPRGGLRGDHPRRRALRLWRRKRRRREREQRWRRQWRRQRRLRPALAAVRLGPAPAGHALGL